MEANNVTEFKMNRNETRIALRIVRRLFSMKKAGATPQELTTLVIGAVIASDIDGISNGFSDFMDEWSTRGLQWNIHTMDKLDTLLTNLIDQMVSLNPNRK